VGRYIACVVVVSYRKALSETTSRLTSRAHLPPTPRAGAFFDSLAQFYRSVYLSWIDATKRSPAVGRRDQATPQRIDPVNECPVRSSASPPRAARVRCPGPASHGPQCRLMHQAHYPFHALGNGLLNEAPAGAREARAVARNDGSVAPFFLEPGTG